MVEPEVALDGGARALDEVGTLAEMLALAHQLERTQWRGRGELRLGERRAHRLGVAGEVERLDRHDVALDGEGAEQQLREPARLLRLGLGPAVLGDVARDAGQRERRGRHHLVHPRGRREEPGEVAHGELDAVEDFGKRHQLAQLREPAERLHAADDGVERLAIARRGAERPGRAVERTGDERALAGDEGAHSAVKAAVLVPPRRSLGGRARASGQRLEAQPQADGAGRLRLAPLPHPADEQPELLDRLRHLLARGRVPQLAPVAVGAGHSLEPRRRTRDRLLPGHERGAAQHARRAEELVRGRAVGPADERLQAVEAFSRLEGEEVGSGQRIGHGC